MDFSCCHVRCFENRFESHSPWRDSYRNRAKSVQIPLHSSLFSLFLSLYYVKTARERSRARRFTQQWPKYLSATPLDLQPPCRTSYVNLCPVKLLREKKHFGFSTEENLDHTKPAFLRIKLSCWLYRKLGFLWLYNTNFTRLKQHSKKYHTQALSAGIIEMAFQS